MPRKDSRNTPRQRARKGEGSYYYDKTTGHHRYTIKHKGRAYTVKDQDAGKAKAKYEELKRQLAAGVDVQASRQTVQQWAIYYLESVILHDVKHSTRVNYTQRYAMHIADRLGAIPIGDLTPGMIIAWRNSMIERKIAPSSIKQALNLLRRMLAHAVIERAIDRNPAADIRYKAKPMRVGKAATEQEQTLTDEQIATLLQHAGPRPPKRPEGKPERRQDLTLLYQLTAVLGFRQGEVLALRVEDVDLAAQTITIRQIVQTLEGQTSIRPGAKTDRSQRAIPIPPSLHQAIAAYLLKTGRRSGLLFQTSSGSPITPRNLVRHFKATLERAELPNIRFHDLRHTAITRMRRAGIRAEVIAAIVGHATVDMTIDYTETNQADMREALAKVS